MDKTSISVPVLQRMLGLKKGAAYWLINQGHFEVIIVGKKMRVKLDSFEKWYTSQFHYKKVDGPAPGQKYANTLSASEVGAALGMEGCRLYEFLKTEPFHIVWVDGQPASTGTALKNGTHNGLFSTRPSLRRRLPLCWEFTATRCIT